MSYSAYCIHNSLCKDLTSRLRDVLDRVCPDGDGSRREEVLHIRLALADDPELPASVTDQVVAAPEQFVLWVEEPTVYLVGGDLRGLRYAVEALAERLGEGQYLSFTTTAPQPDVIDPADWAQKDVPLANRRILFNWHNFMSGCSGWNEQDWFRWIDHGLQHRLNGIMVHCYSNSPMLAAEVNGVQRPVGWLTTSVKGRDWGAQHVNDVRRIPGAQQQDGTNLFEGPAFGADAGLVPDEERIDAMKGLMRRVFDHARSKDMEVYLAMDVDCQTDHPQAILDTLPSGAKIEVQTPAGVKAFVHPEHPEGVAVYRQMIENLLSGFPQVTRLVAWFRGQRNAWGLLSHLRVSEMPEDWQSEYRRLEPEFKEAMQYNSTARPPYLFALAKIVQVFQRVLNELGRGDIELLCGSWDMAYLDSFHFFVDRSVPLIVLDYAVEFESHDFRQAVSGVSGEREVIPVLWAHHDDHSYIGRSYVPVPRLQSRLEGMGVDSFGIIHWTTRPLDLYFKNTCRQVWQASRNEALQVTTRKMVLDLFGEENAEHLTDYLYLWITTSPIFGVETNQQFMSDRFKPYEDPTQQILLARKRLEMLDNLPAPGALGPQGREWLAFYREAEEFVIAFHACVDVMLRCEDVPAEEARELLSRVSPEEALRRYGRHIAQGETTQGERGVLVSMATRWVVYAEELRQMVGLAPVRLNFAPTQHDPLATLPGLHTFFYEEDGTTWLQLGEQETGAPARDIPGGEELEAHGLDLSGGVTLRVTGWFGRPLRIPAAHLRLSFTGDGSGLQVECRDQDGRNLQAQELQDDGRIPVTLPEGTAEVVLKSDCGVLMHCCMEAGGE